MMRSEHVGHLRMRLILRRGRVHGELIAKACHCLHQIARGSHATGLPIERYELLARTIGVNFKNTANSGGIEFGFDIAWD